MEKSTSPRSGQDRVALRHHWSGGRQSFEAVTEGLTCGIPFCSSSFPPLSHLRFTAPAQRGRAVEAGETW